MPEPLKNYYTREFIEGYAAKAAEVISDFDQEKFADLVFSETWADLELKERIAHIAQALKEALNPDFATAVDQLVAISEQVGKSDFLYLFGPSYIGQFGANHWEASVNGLRELTRFSSSELDVRYFILQRPEEMISIMLDWTKHENHHVRRLASEGCRPRLPWAMALPFLKKDPTPIVPILETLRNDDSEYVRRSVANNLNDIAKDNPEVVMDLAEAWFGESPETDWVIKHGCRTLLRKAHPRAMKLFGLGSADDVEIEGLATEKASIAIGDDLHFDFQLKVVSEGEFKLRVEYGIDYVKASGKTSRKLFKITENTYKGPATYEFTRRQRFQDFTTRKHYPGSHKLAVVINGMEKAIIEFDLTAG